MIDYTQRHIINIIRFELAEHFKSQPEKFTEQAKNIYEAITKEYSITKKEKHDSIR